MQERILDNTYRLLEEIGRGGFGAVYRAVRIGAEGSGPVAIKLLNYNPAMQPQDYVRFQREATLMSQLTHPGTVAVYELGEDTSAYYIVMEFISGPNLRDHVKARGGRLPLPDILDILVQSAEALEYVHGHSIVHRDIKPQNILVCESRDRGEPRTQVKIVDFGVARLSYSVLAVPDAEGNASVPRHHDEIVGTYTYMAPESTGLVSWPVDSRSDIYSLGIVAYELLAGKTPFFEFKEQALLRAHIEADPPAIKNIRGMDVPAIFENLIRKCISKKPEDRYQSMFALLCDLKRLQQSMRTQGTLEEFELATKDFGIGEIVNRVFVGREETLQSILQFATHSRKRSRLSWGVIRGGVGLGKSRMLNEVRTRLEQRESRYLYMRFSESEQRLPFQALSLAINDYLLHFERVNRDGYQKFLAAVKVGVGNDGSEIARLIPALRPLFATEKSSAPDATPPSAAMSKALSKVVAPADENSDNTNMNINEVHDKRYSAPSARINQCFAEVFVSLVGEDSELVFLLDDVHLADTSTLVLFQFLIEQVNESVNYSFVLTMRDKYPRSNPVLENFSRRLASLKRRFQAWELAPLETNHVSIFLREMGMRHPPREFVEFVHQKCNGSPLQLHSLLKQMLASDVIHPMTDSGSHSVRDFSVDWDRLPLMVVDFVNIEVVMASLDSLEKRDLFLMRIAAVSYDACEFEYFRIDTDFSRLEVETRLVSLVRRGIFEIIGDENAPLQRRSFVFAHEKLRNAVLVNMDLDSRRQLHVSLASRIESLYRNPQREQVLSLAKHYDGAADFAAPDTAANAFLRAVRLYIKSNEHNLAKYYIEKAIARAGQIPSDEIRLARLREVFEAEYMIHAAQGNLVAASDVCKQLIEITFEPEKKETLQIFWAQLLLGLGRHMPAYEQAIKVLRPDKLQSNTPTMKRLSQMNMKVVGTFAYPKFVQLTRKVYSAQMTESENRYQALAIMALAQFHGLERDVAPLMLLMMRLNAISKAPGRFRAVFALLHAALLMRAGSVEESYKICDQVEDELDSRGIVDAARWVRVLRAIWLDYPMGRIDRLLNLFENQKEGLLPNSGLMHFESNGLRAWLRLIAPGSNSAKETEANEKRRRRKSDRSGNGGTSKGSKGIRGGDALLKSASHDAVLLEPGKDIPSPTADSLDSNSARRVLDSGENSHYTAMALFSDALRFALVDKLEPLRRACEQLKRQKSNSNVGEAYASFAFALNALVAGRQKEALEYYLKAVARITRRQIEVLSLPVTDGLRLATILLPLLAASFNARGWPWGTALKNILDNVDATLTSSEGAKNPRRNAVSVLYQGFRSFLGKNRKESFELLGTAVEQSRVQRVELVECLALSILGTCSVQAQLSRASEHMVGAFRLARGQNWRLLERQVLGMARRTHVDIEKDVVEEGTQLNTVSRQRQVSLAVNHLLSQMQRLTESSSVEELLSESARISAQALGAKYGMVFLLEPGQGQGPGAARERFISRSQWIEKNLTTGALTEAEVLKLLTRSADESVKLVCLDDDEPRAADGGRRAHALPPPPPAPHPRAFGSSAHQAHAAPSSAPATLVSAGPAALSAPATLVSVAAASAAPITAPDLSAPALSAPELSSPELSSPPTVAGTVAGNFAARRLQQEMQKDDRGQKNEWGNVEASWLPAAQNSDIPALRSAKTLPRLPQAAQNDSKYLVLVAIAQGRTLLGWLALGRVSLSRYAARDIEQDLVLLGLNTGHLLSKMRNAQDHLAQAYGAGKKPPPFRRTVSVIEGELPRGMSIEMIGNLSSQPSLGWKTFSLSRDRLLVLQWRFAAGTREPERKLYELVFHHVALFVDSLRQKGDMGRLETVMLRLFSDLTTIVESVARQARFDALDLNLLLIDGKEKRAMEGVFGEELSSFSGQSTVENEFLQEISGVLTSDRLVYRERSRRFTQVAGWLFAGASATKMILPLFARPDFVVKYLSEKRMRGNLTLPAALGLEEGHEPPAMGIFYLDAESEPLLNNPLT